MPAASVQKLSAPLSDLLNDYVYFLACRILLPPPSLTASLSPLSPDHSYHTTRTRRYALENFEQRPAAGGAAAAARASRVSQTSAVEIAFESAHDPTNLRTKHTTKEHSNPRRERDLVRIAHKTPKYSPDCCWMGHRSGHSTRPTRARGANRIPSTPHTTVNGSRRRRSSLRQIIATDRK